MIQSFIGTVSNRLSSLNLNDEIDGLPGQAVIVHVTVSISSRVSSPARDTHWAPLYCGAGLLHVLLLDIMPTPQVAEHEL